MSLLTVAALLAFTGGCRRPSAASHAVDGRVTNPAGKTLVAVVNYPLAYWAQRLGGDSVQVYFPMQGKGDPAYWEPDAAAIGALQKADLILLNGAGYSPWTERTTLPGRRMIDTSRAFRSDHLPATDAPVTHSHGPSGEHTHGTVAFTTWLDPRLARMHIASIAVALMNMRPGDAEIIRDRQRQLEAEWTEWEEAFKALTRAAPGRPVIASHPVYQYLIKAGGLNWRSVHWEPGEEPSPEQWTELKSILQTHPARWMVWEGEPAASVRARLARDFGITCVVFDHCGDAPDGGDLKIRMKENLEALRRVYGAP